MKITQLARAIKIAVFAAIPLSSLTYAQADDSAMEQEIETITVTGQKIDRSLQETANSVSVTTAKALEQLDISSPSDLFQHIPNVHGGTNQALRYRYRYRLFQKLAHQSSLYVAL